MATSDTRTSRNEHSSAQDNANSTPAAHPANKFIPATKDAKRLYWALTGPLSTSIFVMPEPFYDPNAPLEPYVRGGSSGADASDLHPVSPSPLTEPKIRSATVSVDVLDDWEKLWGETHDGHWDGPDDDWEAEGSQVRFGMIPGEDPEYEGFPGQEHLRRCCGVDRPLDKAAKLVVEATGEFLTVHDFVSAVHPWLLGLRDDILAAYGDAVAGKPLPPGTKLMVSHPKPGSLMVMPEERWKASRKKHPLHDRLAAMTWLCEPLTYSGAGKTGS